MAVLILCAANVISANLWLLMRCKPGAYELAKGEDPEQVPGAFNKPILQPGTEAACYCCSEGG